MWSCAIVCMFLVGATAKGLPIDQSEPCCSPQYFTFRETNIVTTAPDGDLIVEFEGIEGAYDAISEQYSVFYDAEFFNGTETRGRFIADFKERTLYVIITVDDKEHCYIRTLDNRFPEDCIPEDAHAVQDAWLGEQDLLVDSWYHTLEQSSDEEAHVVLTVGNKECVPISRVATIVDPNTGETRGVYDSRTLDFNLGICDRDKYFKVPGACQKGNALKKPTKEVRKILGTISRRRKFFGQ